MAAAELANGVLAPDGEGEAAGMPLRCRLGGLRLAYSCLLPEVCQLPACEPSQG